MVRVFTAPRDTFTVLLHIARDVSGAWWDAGRGIPFTESVPDPRTPEFDEWCTNAWAPASGNFGWKRRPRPLMAHIVKRTTKRKGFDTT